MKVVAFSDPHSKHRGLTIPDGDVLVCAGDITFKTRGNPGLDHVADFFDWFEGWHHPHKVFVAGNHDFAFEFGIGQSMMTNGVIYLDDSATEIDGLVFWGSPYTPRFHDWAFNVDRGHLHNHWDRIPNEVDVLITHGPAFGHNDTLPWTREQVGDEELLEAIERIQPKLHICGHIHCGAGTSIIGGTRTINVSVVNEDYELVNPCRVEEVET